MVLMSLFMVNFQLALADKMADKAVDKIVDTTTDEATSKNLDKQAFDIKAHLNTMSENLKSISTEFSQNKKISFISEPLISKGKLIFVLKEGLIWEISTPFQSKTLVNKQGVFDLDTHPMQKKNDPQMQALADIISLIFTGDFTDIETLFTVNNIQNSHQEAWQFTLEPKKAFIKKVLNYISFKGSQNQLSQVEIFDNENNKTQIDFMDIIRNPSLSPEILALFKTK